MILAAGLGTRLRPLTETVPKPLLEVGGTPLIVWNLLLLRRAGVREVIVNLHHLGRMIEEQLGDGTRYGMRLTYSREPQLLGTGGGLKQAAWFFGDEAFLVMNGDTLLEVDLAALIAHHERHRPLATLLVRPDRHVEQWGVVECRGGRVLRINGRGMTADTGHAEVERLMFAGVHVLQPRVLATLPSGQPASIIDAYVAALASREQLLAYRFTGYWSDVGTPERYAQAQKDVAWGLVELRRRLDV